MRKALLIAAVMFLAVNLTHAQEKQPAKNREAEKEKAKISKLLTGLSSEEWRERESAHQELIKLLESGSALALEMAQETRKTTGDEEIEVRLKRILRLYDKYRITPDILKAVPNITRLCENGPDEQLCHALRAVDKLHSEDAAGLFTAILMRETIGTVCQSSSGPVIILEEAGMPNADWVASEALVRLGEDSIPYLAELLGHTDTNKAHMAAKALSTIGTPAIAHLAKVCLYKSASAREWAAYAMRLSGNKAAVKPLKELLKDDDATVRTTAVQALAEIVPTEAKKLLLEMLMKENDADVRGAIAEELGGMPGADTVRALIPMLKDKSWFVRYNAVQSLRKMHDGTSLEPFIEALKDELPEVRSIAAQALGDIRDKKAVGPLIALLKDEDIEVRIHVSQSLGLIGDPKAIKPMSEAFLADEHASSFVAEDLACFGEAVVGTLVRGLDHKEQGVREEAAKALGATSSREALKPLIKALDDKSWLVRCRAAEALGRIGDERAIKPLIAKLRDQGSRFVAANELKRFGMAAVEPLIEMLKDKDEFARGLAHDTLRKITRQNPGKTYKAWSDWYAARKKK